MLSIEGLVELGMTPMEALVAATKHGAMASNALAEYGTVEAGKYADLLLLDQNPLEDIGNIRTLSMVMKEGVEVDFESLPTNPVYFRTER
jgi:imidazolonepropionase-like amidohydrolase